MAHMLLLLVTGFCFGSADDFSCDLASITSALPRLKMLLSESSYEKVKDLHDKIAKGRAPSNRHIGKSLFDLFDDDHERTNCFAALRIKHGYLSMTDPCIAKYLELDADSVSNIRAINTGCVDAINDAILKASFPMTADEFIKLITHSMTKYSGAHAEVRKKLTARQAKLLDDLFVKYDHESAVRKVLFNLVSKRSMDVNRIKGYQKVHPNMQMHVRAEFLIIMDHQAAREFLGLNSEQNAQVQELFSDYSQSVKQLQDSLSESITKSPDESFRFHRQTAGKLNQKYSEKFLAILNSKQKKMIDQLKAQVIGYRYCFTLQAQLAITREQEKMLGHYLSNRMLDFPEPMIGADLDYEKLYRRDQFFSKIIFEEILTQEQRDKWPSIIGKEIPEPGLTALRKAFIARTAHWVKPPTGTEKK